jgi:hypothetical protein
MDLHRKCWNDQQKLLRQGMEHPSQESHARTIELFLSQHAAVHHSAVSGSGGWSFADEVWQGLAEQQARGIPPGWAHSIAWLTWHCARIEDITMGMLLAGKDQLLHLDGWYERMQVPYRDTGNAMSPADVAHLSAHIDLPSLTAYRIAVGQRTRQLVSHLQPEDLKQHTDSGRLQSLLAEGDIIPTAQEVINYWGGLTFAGLLLMPPTRHNFIHLNEGLKVKAKLR